MEKERRAWMGWGVSGIRRVGWMMLACLGLVACGDDDEDPTLPAPGPAQVLARSEEAGRGECPHGGTAVLSGLDHNRNQILEAEEAQTRTVLCNPAPADPLPVVVLRLIAEPAGANCAEGGTAVQSGRDLDRDGHLGDDEVEHTDYVCDAQLVTRMAPEAAGANCVAGGLAFHIGRDRDNDGALADAEIEWTEYECSDVLTRDVMISSPADAAALAAIRVIDGDLEIRGFTAQTLELPLLQHVSGSLLVNFNYLNTTLVSLRLPRLTEVVDDLRLENNHGLTTVEALVLREIGGDLKVSSNSTLRELDDLPGLRRVGGDVIVSSNEVLEEVVVIPELDTSTSAKLEGKVEVRFNPALTQLSLGAHELHDVELLNNDALPAFTLEAIRAGRISISSNPLLAAITVHVPVLGEVFISGNQALRTVDVRAVDISGDFYLSATGSTEIRSLTLTHFSAGVSEPLKIHGTLTVLAGIDTFTSAQKIQVLGDCTIGATRLTSLHAIKSVEGRFLLSTNALLTSDISPIPVKGGIGIFRNAQLRSLAFLQPTPDQAGEVAILENDRLTDLGPIATVVRNVDGAFRITSNPQLAAAQTFVLTTVAHWLLVSGNAALTGARFPQLRSVASVIEVMSNAALVDVQMPALRRALSIEASQNAALRQLGLPDTAQLEALSVYINPQLPSCSLAPLCARLPAEACHVWGNDEAIPCP